MGSVKRVVTHANVGVRKARLRECLGKAEVSQLDRVIFVKED